jgi:hypothetical protein
MRRFFEKFRVQDYSVCWEWQGSRYPTGYGKFRPSGPKQGYAHRFAYEFWHGPIPEGMLVMHSCDNPPCVNPQHLSVGTYSDNAQDRENKGRGRW